VLLSNQKTDVVIHGVCGGTVHNVSASVSVSTKKPSLVNPSLLTFLQSESIAEIFDADVHVNGFMNLVHMVAIGKILQ
jgi:hypothetical protein